LSSTFHSKHPFEASPFCTHFISSLPDKETKNSSMPPRQRSPDDVHDIFNVQVGRPYRGSMVEKIDIETTNLPSGKVKVRRLILCDTGIVLIEDTWHEYGEVFQDGKLLPYDQINFPRMDPADFAMPVRTNDDDDDDEQNTKRDLLRQRAKEMLRPKRTAPDEGEKLRIRVNTPDGTTLPIVAKNDDTVGNLGDRLEGEHGYPVDDHDLWRNGKPLDRPNRTLDDCGIHDGDVLDLEPRDASFTVRVRAPDGKILPVEASADDTVDDLKDALEDDHGIPFENYELCRKGKPLDEPNATMDDCGVRDGDVLELVPTEGTPMDDPSSKTDDLGVPDGDTLGPQKQPRGTLRSGDASAPSGRDRARSSKSPCSAWVFPTRASAPTNGDTDRLQGIWSVPPAKGSPTDPVEVNLHPWNQEPESEGRSDVHGAYGSLHGAKPDAEGVFDPASVVFYPPGCREYGPGFDPIGWWSATESHSTTTVSWRFEGEDCFNVRTHTVNVMGHEMTFVKEWKD